MSDSNQSKLGTNSRGNRYCLERISQEQFTSGYLRLVDGLSCAGTLTILLCYETGARVPYSPVVPGPGLRSVRKYKHIFIFLLKVTIYLPIVLRDSNSIPIT